MRLTLSPSPKPGGRVSEEVFLSDGWQDDPRLSSLGQRRLHPRGESLGSGETSEVDPAEFQRWRYQLGVAEGDTEMPSGVDWTVPWMSN